MRLIISGLILGLLVGCRSIALINGTYDLDAKCSATNAAESLISQGMEDVDEDFIKNLEQILLDHNAVITINYPDLRVIHKTPGQVDESFELREIDENKFEFYAEIEGEMEHIILSFDPTEEVLFLPPYKYIKR